MRKLITLAIVSLLLFCGTASAEGLDLTTMSTDALLALREQLNAEITARIGDDNALIADGVYVAGVDIKPGMYRITCTAAFDDREFYVNLFLSLDDYKTYDKSRWNNASYRFSQAVLLPGMETIVNLAEGMTIEIYNGLGRVEAVQPSWSMGDETENAMQSTSSDEEWKQFLKEYETFVDHYVEIVKKYTANPSDMTILSDYAKVMSELADWSMRADEIAIDLEDSPEKALEFSMELFRLAAKIAEAAN